jgi:hypothetical protein
MDPSDQERQWTAELERQGENAIRSSLYSSAGVTVGLSDERKRQHAFRWLRETEREREQRERSTHRYVQWTFWAAVAAVIVGIIGVAVTLLGH